MTGQTAEGIGLRRLVDAELFVPVLRLNLEENNVQAHARVFCLCIL